MNIEKLKRIIQYSDIHKTDIETKVEKFYTLAEMSNGKDVLNIMQIVRPFFRKGDI